MEQDSEIDYSNMRSVSDIRRQFNTVDYTRSIACPKDLTKKPAPPVKPITAKRPPVPIKKQPLIVNTNDEYKPNPFQTIAEHEANNLLTMTTQQQQQQGSRMRTNSGQNVKKSVSDMFDDAFKIANNHTDETGSNSNNSEVKIISSSGVSMECASSTSSERANSSLHQTTTSSPRHIHTSPQSSNHSPTTTTQQKLTTPKPTPPRKPSKSKLSISPGSGGRQRSGSNSFSNGINNCYLGSLQTDPNIDLLMEFCQETIKSLG